jgi:two-component system OmpR family sensor kinase
MPGSTQMYFDDRLTTVLRKPVTGEAIARIQYRQLLDLLGTCPSDIQDASIDAAYLRLTELSQSISAAARAAMLREPMVRLRAPRLVAHLTQEEPTVASAAIECASLSDEQWLDLIPALPIGARGIIRQRSGLGLEVETLLLRLGIGDRALPPAKTIVAIETPPQAAVTPIETLRPAEPIEGIGAIVRRIEQFRKTRQQEQDDAAGNDAPRLPLEDGDDAVGTAHLETFDFATDAEGRIVWSEPAAAPMNVGLLLATLDPDNPVAAPASLVTAFRHRQPVSAASLRIDGAPAIAGDWHIDAAPRFEQPGGRFTGYCGRMRRPAAGPPQPVEASAPDGDADRMRQILHELRTPVNAIQGFAEVIQQQLFGPTPHEYRALAASIASDGARILAGFEELDRLVKLDAGAMELDAGECDIAAIVTTTIARLKSFTAPRASGFSTVPHGGPMRVAIAASEAERMIWRLLATLAGTATPGELLKLKIRAPQDGMVRIIVRLPAALADRDDQALFHATAATAPPPALAAGMFGTGFALRLAAAEALAAGGELERREGKLRLSLPAAGIRRTAGSDIAFSPLPLDAATSHRG